MCCSTDRVRTFFTDTYMYETADQVVFPDGQKHENYFNVQPFPDRPFDRPFPPVPLLFGGAATKYRNDRYVKRIGDSGAPVACSMGEYYAAANRAGARTVNVIDIGPVENLPFRRLVRQEFSVPVHGLCNILKRVFCCK